MDAFSALLALWHHYASWWIKQLLNRDLNQTGCPQPDGNNHMHFFEWQWPNWGKNAICSWISKLRLVSVSSRSCLALDNEDIYIYIYIYSFIAVTSDDNEDICHTWMSFWLSHDTIANNKTVIKDSFSDNFRRKHVRLPPFWPKMYMPIHACITYMLAV